MHGGNILILACLFSSHHFVVVKNIYLSHKRTGTQSLDFVNKFLQNPFLSSIKICSQNMIHGK